MEALSKLGISPGFLLMQFIAFFIIMALLRMWAWDPIVQFLQRRREKLAQALEDARVAAEARANAEAEAERILAEARTRAEEIIAEARRRAEEVAQQERVRVQEELKRWQEQARAEMEAERNRVLGELREQIAALAVAAAQKIIQESLNEERQHALLREFFAGLRDGQLLLEDQALRQLQGADRVEVVSAVPLTDEEKATLRQLLAQTLGDAVSVDFQVDPAILGGLILRAGDRVVDASVARQLQALRTQLVAA